MLEESHGACPGRKKGPSARAAKGPATSAKSNDQPPGQAGPMFICVTCPMPVYTNFCTRFPS